MVRTALALGLLLVLAVSAIAVHGSTAALELDTAARPHIVQNPIPFPARRKLQTRRYARRHYGLDTYTLDRPKVIVQHFTGSTSFQSAYNTFASNQPDVELHERPGVCTHFIVARDGTIHQLVSLSLMCRHTIGLNWTAVGIEHVGVSDRGHHGQPPPARGLAEVDAMAPRPACDQDAERDRACGEPLQPLPP